MAEHNLKRETIDNNMSKSFDPYDTAKDNMLRAVNEIAKFHPQYLQSISNLELDYIQTMKNVVHALFSSQKAIADITNVSAASAPYVSQIVSQIDDATTITMKLISNNNQFTINMLDAARENLKIYNKTLDSFTEFNLNLIKTFSTMISSQTKSFSL
jgi:hypothetical protein